MSQEYAEPIYRTTTGRLGGMMAIMLGICIVGGAIFFGMWDYWISEVPPVAASDTDDTEVIVQATGQEIHWALSFVESDDFRILGFDALPGEPNSNPTINANVGDEIHFDVVNDGKSFHSFGVTRDTEGWDNIIAGSEIGSMNDPLKPGESGTSTFIPAEPGEYYYICTVPGHRAQGMVGTIVVGEAQESTAEASAPTGVSHDLSLDFVESEDLLTLGFDALPGEEGSNPDFTVESGDEVTFTVNNVGRSFHSFGITTSPDDFGGSLWGSEIGSMNNPLKPGESGSVTFIAGAPGMYHYICTVPGHALQGMSGSFVVE